MKNLLPKRFVPAILLSVLMMMPACKSGPHHKNREQKEKAKKEATFLSHVRDSLYTEMGYSETLVDSLQNAYEFNIDWIHEQEEIANEEFEPFKVLWLDEKIEQLNKTDLANYGLQIQKTYYIDDYNINPADVPFIVADEFFVAKGPKAENMPRWLEFHIQSELEEAISDARKEYTKVFKQNIDLRNKFMQQRIKKNKQLARKLTDLQTIKNRADSVANQMLASQFQK